MVQVIPQSVANLWNQLNIRVVVVGSLCIQILLILFGSRRKYTAKNWVRVLVWVAYLSADSVAVTALGMISSFQGSGSGTPDDNKNYIMAFWAPFLILHLGGPDTITAYAMEDNDLWLRHLLNLCIQVSLALYIFLRSWTSSSYRLALLEIPILVAGTIKYGERNWLLRSVSEKKIENMVTKHKNIMPPMGSSNIPDEEEERFLRETSEFFTVVTYLYTGKADSRTCKETSYSSYSSEYSSRQEEDWLKQADLVLGFMYDVLYTKAKLVYSSTGIIFRCVSLFCCIATFAAFCLFIDKKVYSRVDIIITYLLLIGAIVLELYAIIVVLFTDWTQYWLRSGKQKPSCLQLAYPNFQALISSIRSKFSYDKTWSETMAQFNLIDFCTEWQKPPCARINQLLGIAETVEKNWHLTLEEVPNQVKQLIFRQILKTRIENSINVVLGFRGNHSLRENECFRELSWSISPQSYGRSILLWHIATSICFYDDCNRGKFQDSSPLDNSKYFRIGMLLSNYMAYVLIMQRFLLPEANFNADCIEYRLIFAEFFKTRADLLSLPELHHLSKVQGYRDVVPLAYQMSTRSNLDLHSDARHYDWRTWLESIRLAQQIQLLEAQGKLTNEKKWKMITEVWIETLCYAALQCPWSAHAMQLRRGGELLTYVHLLMAKLGINNAFRELGGG